MDIADQDIRKFSMGNELKDNFFAVFPTFDPLTFDLLTFRPKKDGHHPWDARPLS